MTQYTPRTLPKLEQEDFQAWVKKEFEAVALALQNPDYILLKKFHAAPKKIVEGMTLIADGTDWNPGAGAGVYTYYDSGWKKLG
jgi:hypothetical protein